MGIALALWFTALTIMVVVPLVAVISVMVIVFCKR